MLSLNNSKIGSYFAFFGQANSYMVASWMSASWNNYFADFRQVKDFTDFRQVRDDIEQVKKISHFVRLQTK